LRRCQIIPAGLCHVHAGYARTYVPHTLAGNTVSLPADSRNSANAISTIQTGHRKVTLQRQRHKNVRRVPFGFRRVLTAFPFRGTSLFQTQIHIVREHAG